MKRTTSLRQSAHGKQCLVRLPGICNHDPATVVAAHLRRAGMAGTGCKPADILTVRACHNCHREIDRETHYLDQHELDSYVLDALCRTLLTYEKEGLIHVGH